MSRTRYLMLPMLALLPVLAGCARTPVAVAVAPPAAPVVAAPMPRPPLNAAPTLALPQPAADGSFVTPNRGLSPAATIWHLRAALNVAVLQCAKPGDPAEAGYNAFLAAHKADLAAAFKTLEREYRGRAGAQWQDAFDDSMTRLYNFYAQPPARAAYCAAAEPLIAQAAATTPATLPAFAPGALAALDRPFTDFYAAYHGYRIELAQWKAGQAPAVPRLTVDPQIFVAGTDVTVRGRVMFAAR
ncbi:hypothetical protein OKW76_10220 [Sphingomonas sp. S1-29]|uniref:hypothetical protein n=1 Tax=Sphingomonas sp. S1-29 TaxID=2991074 RepID=UPI00223F2621|nr:hypothetical protein [Sphingomonas sp. S1-29]UZK68438.1 hypothetical protein OKW76_10220 [Sphingomonas sp. S1-29]